VEDFEGSDFGAGPEDRWRRAGLADGVGSARDYCRAAVRKGDRDRYLAALFAPVSRRGDLLALAAFNLEIARAREQVREPMLGLIRLQWWREALDAIYAGGALRKHPVAEALADAIRRHDLPRDPFERLIAARERDMEPAPNKDMDTLEDYAAETSVPLFLLNWKALTAGKPDADDPFKIAVALANAGTGYALTGLLRALPFHAAAGRIYLPRDRVEAAGLTVQDLARPEQLPARAAIIRDIAQTARSRLDRARPDLNKLPRAASPLRLSCALARRHLDRLAAAQYEPHAPAVQATPPWTVWQLSWWHWTGRG